MQNVYSCSGGASMAMEERDKGLEFKELFKKSDSCWWREWMDQSWFCCNVNGWIKMGFVAMWITILLLLLLLLLKSRRGIESTKGESGVRDDNNWGWGWVFEKMREWWEEWMDQNCFGCNIKVLIWLIMIRVGWGLVWLILECKLLWLIRGVDVNCCSDRWKWG